MIMKSNGQNQHSEPFQTVLVGCGGMGRNQAKILADHADYTLTAVCDMDAERAQAMAREVGVKAYTDFAEMLGRERPEVVAIPTGNKAHGPLTIQAAEFGVQGIYCEKPMAMNMNEARRMVEICREKNTLLVINHQRRLGADLVEARRLVESGAIGDVQLVRGQAAGDMLSDGTHVVDSLLFVLGDPAMKTVTGHLIRDLEYLRQKWTKMKRPEPVEGFGYRYGHAVESGAMAVVELETGVRMELFTGDLREDKRVYQDYVITGSKGTLWRLPDRFAPHNLFISDAEGGDHVIGEVDFHTCPVPAQNGRGLWRKISLESQGAGKHGIVKGYQLMAESLRTGAAHPMAGEIALRGFEIVMGVYASARQNRRLSAPIDAEEFPLELMLAQPTPPATS